MAQMCSQQVDNVEKLIGCFNVIFLFIRLIMDSLYTARLHGFLSSNRTAMETNLTEEGVLSLLIVLGSSLSLVALVFAFITYR